MNETSNSDTGITDQQHKRRQDSLLKHIRAKLHAWAPGMAKFARNLALLFLWMLCLVSLAFCIYRFFAASSLEKWDVLAVISILTSILIMSEVGYFRQKNKGFRFMMEDRHPVLTHPGQWKLLPSILVISAVSLFLLVASWHAWAWADLRNGSARATASLAVVGGLGLMVSLVVAYRKQSLNERVEGLKEFTDSVVLLDGKSTLSIRTGVYSLIRVGTSHPHLRQQVIDTLTEYLRRDKAADASVESLIIAQIRNVLSTNNSVRWRNIKLDLHGIVFRENCNFSNCIINKADFKNSVFLAGQMFIHTQFMMSTSFSGTHFRQEAQFQLSEFHGRTDFDGAVFDGRVRFNHTRFMVGEGEESNIVYTQNQSSPSLMPLQPGVNFCGTKFKSSLFFNNAEFNNNVYFGSQVYKTLGVAQFEQDILFDETEFNQGAFFGKSAFKGGVSFKDVVFHDPKNKKELNHALQGSGKAQLS
ncbi:MAG: pentapeptide repeat-containing protein [Bifidobacterium sp.]